MSYSWDDDLGEFVYDEDEYNFDICAFCGEAFDLNDPVAYGYDAMDRPFCCEAHYEEMVCQKQ